MVTEAAALVPSTPWTSRSHFFAVAATAIRQILVNEARRKGAQKRGGDAPATRSQGRPQRAVPLWFRAQVQALLRGGRGQKKVKAPSKTSKIH